MAEMSRYASEVEKKGWKMTKEEREENYAICQTLFDVLRKSLADGEVSLKVGKYLGQMSRNKDFRSLARKI